VTWVPIFSSLQATTDVDIAGFELMKSWPRRQAGSRFGFTHHWLAGVRYIDLDERFSLNAAGSFFGPTTVTSLVENFIIGPQIGNEFCRRVGDWRVGGSLRFLWGINSQRGEQSGSYAVNGTPGGQNQPLNLNPGAFSTVDEGTSFAPVFEWRVDVNYDIGRHVAARVGYTGFVIGGIGRAANSIEYALPSFGMSLSDDDSLVFNAFTAGLEFYFH
jgi:hypothetical protein